MFKFLLGLSACVLLTSPAHASAVTGKDLIKSCDSSEQFAGGFCFGFIAGIADGLDNVSFCIPLDVTLSQERATVRQYLREHPQDTDRQAAQLVIDTFKQAYPCHQGKLCSENKGLPCLGPIPAQSAQHFLKNIA